MLRWLAQNLTNILLSVALAVIVWVVAENEANPNREDILRGVPIVYVNRPPDTEVYAASAASVEVTLSAPEATWAGLSTSVISATIDLSSPTIGADVYPVRIDVPDSIERLVRVARVEPASISLRVEPRSSVTISVSANLLGEPPATHQVGRVVSRPPTVTVTGPESWVNQVAEVVGDVSIQSASAPVSQTVVLKPLDVNGQSVPNVKVEPDRALINVGIQQLAGLSNQAVRADITGTLAPGYRLMEVSVTPPNVAVIGSSAALAQLPGFIDTEPIDITGEQSDIVRDVRLNLPSDVALFNQQTVRVTVKIAPIVTSVTITSQPITVGLESGLVARLSPETLDVILQAPLPVLDSINLEQDVRVILDLSGLDVGTHQVEPRIEAPEGVSAQSILPPTVQVIIERAPRATATPRPTPTARP
jgi:YbbR domain-containing protein